MSSLLLRHRFILTLLIESNFIWKTVLYYSMASQRMTLTLSLLVADQHVCDFCRFKREHSGETWYGMPGRDARGKYDHHRTGNICCITSNRKC